MATTEEMFAETETETQTQTADSTPTTNIGGDSPPPSCPECAGNIVEDAHEQVCVDCGLVVGESAVDHGPEWRSFGDTNSEPPRGVQQIDHTRHDNGMGTEGFNPFNTVDRDDLRQSRLSNQRVSKKDRRKMGAIYDIKQATSALELPEAAEETACVLFKKFHDSQDHRGHNLDGMVAGVVYGTCRIYEAGATPQTIAAHFDISRRKLFTNLKRLSETVDTPIPIETVEMFVPRLVSDLGGSSQTQSIARSLAAAVEETDIVGSGCKPSGIAAAVVYEAFRADPAVDRRVQSDIAGAADVTPQTLRDRWNAMRSHGIEGDLRETQIEAN